MTAAKLIRSRDNAVFKTLLKFSKSSHERRKQHVTLLDGPHLIESFHAAGHTIEALVLSEAGTSRPELTALFGRVEARQRIQLSDALFQDIAAVTTPTGIMALVDTPVSFHGPDINIDTLMLESIQDPGNLGSIMRSAAASGVQQILLSRGSVFAWSPKVLRAGMGAHFVLRIFEDCDLADFAGRFEGTCIATETDAKHNLFDLQFDGAIAWMFGNEGAGLSPELAKLAKLRAHIPMPGKIESLNVAAAVAICLFDRVRRNKND